MTINSTLILSSLLNEGFYVDIYSGDGNDLIKKDYDLIIGAGEIWRKTRKTAKLKKILWLMEPIPEKNRKVFEKLPIPKYVKSYLGKEKLNIMNRIGFYYKDSDVRDADAVFYNGEKI